MMLLILSLFLVLAVSVLSMKKLNYCFDTCPPNCSGCPLAGSCGSSCDDDDDDDSDDEEDDED